MQVHSLGIEDFCDDKYTLIGIHTALEDFKLAYLLNHKLNTLFSRAAFSLDFGNEHSKASFSIFDYKNEENDYEWYLISNSYTEETTNAFDTLALSTETKTYLIPEKKKVDFFIKIIGEPTQELVQKTVSMINQIHQVVLSYTIDTFSLKSKEFLIF